MNKLSPADLFFPVRVVLKLKDFFLMFYILDRIFDISNSTQDVYDEFGRPTVLSAMDGFNGEFNLYGNQYSQTLLFGQSVNISTS